MDYNDILLQRLVKTSFYKEGLDKEAQENDWSKKAKVIVDAIKKDEKH